MTKKLRNTIKKMNILFNQGKSYMGLQQTIFIQLKYIRHFDSSFSLGKFCIKLFLPLTKNRLCANFFNVLTCHEGRKRTHRNEETQTQAISKKHLIIRKQFCSNRKKPESYFKIKTLGLFFQINDLFINIYLLHRHQYDNSYRKLANRLICRNKIQLTTISGEHDWQII